MLRGIFSSASGMIAEYKRINVISNNLSNSDTQGFKQDVTAVRSFAEELAVRSNDQKAVGTINAGATVQGVYTDMTQGEMEQTDVDTNLAVSGDGFFAVQGTDGAVKYTRAGNFAADEQGYLALPSGERLLDSNGQPVAAAGISVNTDGTVSHDGVQDTSITLYNGTAEKRQDGFFDIGNAAAVNTGALMEGYVEKSNTDVVDGMTGLMQASRSFQSCSQAYNAATETLDKLVTQVGSLR